MVDHIQSGGEPPNWYSLCVDSSEKMPGEIYDLSRTWYGGESKYEEHQVHVDSSNNSFEISENLREPVGKDNSDASKPGELINLWILLILDSDVKVERGSQQFFYKKAMN